MGRTSAPSGWNTAGGCAYNTSRPAYMPDWCAWSGVSCNARYSIVSVYFYGSSWSPNQVQRTIPPAIAGMKGLTSLTLQYMGYTSTIPSALFAMTSLRTLDLGYNSLSGSIPTGISKLRQLNSLSLNYQYSSGKISGALPSVLWSMPGLTRLEVGGNRVTIPTSIGSATNLYTLAVNDNNVYGATIPSEIGNMANLRYLYMSGSNLVGSIPSTISGLSQLNVLDLSRNGQFYSSSTGLTGTIPAWLYTMSQLQSLRLSGNSLSGTVSSAIASLTNLYSVALDWNRLTGTIPKIFTNMRSGWSHAMYLHHNYFVGTIPVMPYSSASNYYFTYTFDQNCQLTAPASSFPLGPQNNCPPGAAGQVAPTAVPTAAPSRGQFPVISHTLIHTYIPPYLTVFLFLRQPLCTTSTPTAPTAGIPIGPYVQIKIVLVR